MAFLCVSCGCAASRAAPPYRTITQTAWGITSRRWPHLAEGASSCGGGLILRKVLHFAEEASSEAQMRRTYSLSVPRICCCEAPLAPRPPVDARDTEGLII